MMLKTRNGHNSYAAAKSGDAEAAKTLVEGLLSAEAVYRLGHFLAGRQPILLAVTADETAGFNAIPDAMAQALAAHLGLTVAAGTITQANKVGHTRANGWHRLVTPAVFTGAAVAGADYLLCDDHVGFGGTLANLRGFIEAQGGCVIGTTTLTETPGARQIAIRPETLAMLQDKHGRELDQFWRAESDTALLVSPTSRPDTYVVLNLLPPSRVEWLRQQSLRVAEVFRQSPSPQEPS